MYFASSLDCLRECAGEGVESPALPRCEEISRCLHLQNQRDVRNRDSFEVYGHIHQGLTVYFFPCLWSHEDTAFPYNTEVRLSVGRIYLTN